MSPSGIATYVRPRMGTLLAVSLPGPSLEGHRPDLAAVFDTARRCERIMSRRDPASDLSRLNRASGAAGGRPEPALAGILRAARGLARRLDGAFDPAVGSLIDLWRRAGARGAAPPARSITAALALVGPDAIAIAGDRVWLPRPGTAIDLDGFGKGLAVDRAAMALRRLGRRSAFLNFGESSLAAIGRPPGGRWAVALRDPFRGGFAGQFTLSDRACSTSSTIGRRVRIGSRTVGDVIDPRTGRPVERDAQVTVVATSAAAAEAVSTALLVLGRQAVDVIARRLAVDVCWIDGSGIHTTPCFALRRAG